MKFSAFIQTNLDTIVQEWEAYARALLPSSHPLSELALRDHVREMLSVIARDMESGQTAVGGDLRSMHPVDGKATPESAAAAHGALRQLEGLDVSQLFGEFISLRATVLGMWRRAELAMDASAAIDEVARFDEGIDRAVVESIERYAKNVAAFMAVIGNDLRSPLWAIKSSSEMLSTRVVSDEVRREVMDRITRSSEAMGHVIDDLTEFTEINLGRREVVQLSTCDLGAICEAALHTAKARHPRQEFALTSSGDLVLRADARQMQQVLINLLNDAAYHNDKRTPVSIDLRGGTDSIAIRVTSHGRTRAASTLQSVLEPEVNKPMKQAEPHQGPYTGLGVGLFVVREILSRHGGSITLKSERETDTTFTVEVPR